MAGEIFLVIVPQLFIVDVRVNLCCGEVGVSEQFLHRPQVRAASKKMRRKRVAQRMHFCMNTGFCFKLLKIFQIPFRERGSPLKFTNISATCLLPTNDGRTSSRYLVSHIRASSPNGIRRSLSPLPHTIKNCSSKCTLETSSPDASLMRSPQLYISSNNARSRMPSGFVVSIAASSESTCSMLSTLGSARAVLGRSSSSA